MALQAALNGGIVKCKEETKWTQRFEVKLDNPTESNSTEVHYPELLHSEKAPQNSVYELDPLEKDEDAELAALAKKLEEKYAPKKPKRVREEDLVDIGDGYDLNDPFVDDSEAYEDFVPHQVDTLFGGFYINAGNLEYKKAEGMDDLPMKRKQKPSYKKQNSTPKTLLASKKIKLAKQQIATSALRNENMKKKLSNFTKSNPKTLFGKTQAKKDENKMPILSPITEEKSNNDAAMNEDSLKEAPKVLEAPPVLPVDLPPGVEEKIKEIESMVGKADGKLTHKARCAYDSILLEIESDCKELKMKTRSAIFDHVAYIMGVTRGSLMNRIKRTIKKKKGAESNESSLQQLKEAINEIMPAFVSKYEADMAEYEEALKKEKESSNDVMLQQQQQTPGAEDFHTPKGAPDLTPKPKKPRKILKWTPRLKSLLCDVVREKVKSELENKNRTVSGEEAIMDFLQTTIKPIWPKGWFVKKTLYNITQSVHCELTGYSSQKKASIKKEKPEGEDGSLLLPPSSTTTSLSSTSKLIPPYEGSTQASFGSLVDSVPELNKSLVRTSNSNDFVCEEKSSVIASTSLKPTLMPSKHLQQSYPSGVPQTTTVNSANHDKRKSKIVLSKVVGTQTITSSINTAVTSPSGTSTTAVGGASTTASGVRTATNPVLTVPIVKTPVTKKTTKSLVNTVRQKGPTKVAKIPTTTLPNLNLSHHDLNELINTLKNTSQQQLVFLQKSPKGTASNSTVFASSSSKASGGSTTPKAKSSQQSTLPFVKSSMALSTTVPSTPWTASQTITSTVATGTSGIHVGGVVKGKSISKSPTAKSIPLDIVEGIAARTFGSVEDKLVTTTSSNITRSAPKKKMPAVTPVKTIKTVTSGSSLRNQGETSPKNFSSFVSFSSPKTGITRLVQAGSSHSTGSGGQTISVVQNKPAVTTPQPTAGISLPNATTSTLYLCPNSISTEHNYAPVAKVLPYSSVAAVPHQQQPLNPLLQNYSLLSATSTTGTSGTVPHPHFNPRPN